MLALCEPAKESLLKARQPTSGQCSAHARTSTSGSNVQTTMQPPEDLDFLSELPGLPVVAGDKSLPQFPLPPQRPVRINNTDDRWEDDSCPPASLELAQEDAGAGRCKPKQGRFRQRNAAHGSGPHRAATERVSLERLREVCACLTHTLHMRTHACMRAPSCMSNMVCISTSPALPAQQYGQA